MKKAINELSQIIEISIKDDDLFVKALTHRSYLNETDEDEMEIESNERLEFLGDAILQFLTSEYIYNEYSDFAEGTLTNLRSKLVNTESLSSESRRLSFAEYLRVSKGEKETAKDSNYILADIFESILGAIYLDQGIEACREYLTKQLFYKAKSIIESGELKDAKSLYQELIQETHGVTPNYKLIEESGPDHDKVFTVGVYVNSKLVAQGSGSSKRKAEGNAAKNALDKSVN